METIAKINDVINDAVWGPIMLLLIVGTGVYLTFGTGWIQIRKFGYAMKNTIATLFKKGEEGTANHSDGTNVTPFQAVSTALASTVGVGNVAGVAGAIFSGGPGAVFWMWVSAVFGMATKYSEIVLSIKYRQVDENGTYYGGPMYYIEKGLNMKWLAVIFALFGGLCCFGIGNATQAGEISAAVNNITGADFDSSMITGIVLAAVTGIVIIGGIKRISTITSYLVPFMALFYILGGIIIILSNIAEVPRAFGLIFSEAFSVKAAAGGVGGYAITRAMRFGIARGVFSNEAGLGSAPIAHAASSTKDPVKQGLWGIFEVFVDTILVCSITGIVIVISGIYNDGLTGGPLTAAAFQKLIPFGGNFVRIAILLFALSTILGWSYYGERCWGYLTNNNKVVNLIFKVVFIAIVFIGAVSTSSTILSDTSALDVVWEIADTLNGLMALPNLVGLLLLSKVTINLTRDYFKKEGLIR